MLSQPLEDYVQMHIKEMRAPRVERTMFGPAGRQVLTSDGERIILGPQGQRIRVIEKSDGNLIEHEDEQGDTHIHANVRPGRVKLGLSVRS